MKKKPFFLITILIILFGIVYAVLFTDLFDKKYNVVGTSDGMYAYETLTNEGQKVYDEITYAIENHLESIEVSTMSEVTLNKAYWAVYYDHCEYFWTTSYKYETYENKKGELSKLMFYPIYNMTEDEQVEYQKKIDTAVDEILKKVSNNASDFQKVLYAYTTIVEQTKYDIESEHNQDIISVFLNNESVCCGYSYAFQYLLNELDIPCITVFGLHDGESHSWNLVQMDGEYYYMDVTMGEIAYWQDKEYQDNVVNYSYFGLSDDMMEGYEAYNYVPMPECISEECNYFVHEGLYFGIYDEKGIGERIEEAYNNGENTLMLKFFTGYIYDTAYKHFIEESHWADYCDCDEIAYIDQFDENVLLLKFLE